MMLLIIPHQGLQLQVSGTANKDFCAVYFTEQMSIFTFGGGGGFGKSDHMTED